MQVPPARLSVQAQLPFLCGCFSVPGQIRAIPADSPLLFVAVGFMLLSTTSESEEG